MEIWKNINNYEGHYKVSNFGNVKSLKNNKEKLLKGVKDNFGYLMYVLCKDGKIKNIRGHILVAETFLNHKSNGYNLVIDHIDNNPSNNDVSNLRIISHRDNVSRGYKNKSSKYRGVCFHKNKKLWMASGKNNKYLGYFNTEIEAYTKILEYEKNM